jgi:hypothetical protein
MRSRSRRRRLKVDQPPIPTVGTVERGPQVPSQRGGGINGTIRDTVHEVAADMAGEPAPKVLAELLSRLQHRLPGITFSNESLREYARAISQSREP